MSFLKAEWRKLAIANYAIDPEVLKNYLPARTEPDLWNGTCYVSLVGFMFTNVRLLGMPIPFHRNFEEVNLRFYVKHKDGDEWKRGVVFIKELVPKSAITFIANTIYKEHYQTVPMAHHWKMADNLLDIQYSWQTKNNMNRFRVLAENEATDLLPGSETEFITEHYWGYTRIRADKTTEYEVRHPRWKAYAVKSVEIDVDFGIVYGNDFQFLNGQKPVSVMLAEGSEISVENKKTLR
ncbi:MAG: DUF2071 domain-containing protein [Bacteroidetes bacterium]|nr:DUF2071 domain-containing protein [Bacteroidota bacterium]